MSGTLYGLGIGPGDPDLITVKALRILQAAPVIAYPAPETGESLARRIVAAHSLRRVGQRADRHRARGEPGIHPHADFEARRPDSGNAGCDR